MVARGAEANVALYLNPPSNAPAELLRNHLVGVLSTFAIFPTPTNADHGGHGGDGPPAVYSFDVTRLIADLQNRGLWTGELKLASQEITGVLGEASLKLGKVELVETSAGGTQQ
jgi:hypothetical protein